MSTARPQIHCERRLSRRKPFERQGMSLAQVIHMNIVTNAGSIVSRIVRPENLQACSRIIGCHEGEGNQVGFRTMQLPNFSALIRSSSVEITQRRKSQIVGAVIRLESILEEELGDTIGID